MRTLTFIFLLCHAGLMAQQAEPLLFKEKIHDFGEINEDGGHADVEFTFTNNSGRPMKVINVQPSCGCTTSGWTKEIIQQGASGVVKASFDPKGKLGFFNKSLTVTTDLEGQPVVLQIKGQVNGKNHVIAPEDFPVAKGNLRFKSNSFNLDKIFINLSAAPKEFTVYNSGSKAIHFTNKITTPAYIKVETPALLGPHEQGIIKVIYDAKLRNVYGFVSDNVEFTTDDEVPQKSFSVYATIEEFFPALSPAELSKAPALRIDNSTVDFGKIHENTIIDRDVLVRNNGKSELVIRAIQENCSCITASLEFLRLKPGGAARLKISFATQGRTGIQQKAITLFSNDPKFPVQRVTVTAFIE